MAKKTKKSDVKNREDALAQVQKKFGKKVQKASEYEGPDVEIIPSGSVGLDIMLGVGGYPRGRIIEVYGPEASGKTTLTLHAIAEAQKQGGLCAFVDAEHALDLDYASDIGVNVDMLDYVAPDSGEEALEVVELLAKSEEYAAIVVDSVAALVPQAEIEGDMGDSHVGLQARLMGQAMRKLSSIVSRSGTTLFFLNQLRMKVGVMFGNPETTSGGKALAFFASQRLDIRHIGVIKSGDTVVGGRKRIKVIKNKLAGTAYHTHELNMYSNNEFGCGISQVHEIVEKAVLLDIIEKSGSWYSYGDERLGQGLENSVAALRKRPDDVEKIYKQVIELSPMKPKVKARILGKELSSDEEE